MELLEFKRAYNARIREMGAQARAECLGVIKKTEYSGPDGAAGKAELLSVRTQGIGLVHIGGMVNGCIVHAPLEKGKAVDGLNVYSACIDVLMGTNEKQRNELLDRLHLFDGKLTGRGSNRTVKGWTLEVRPGDPAQGWISFAVIDGKTPDLPGLKDHKPKTA